MNMDKKLMRRIFFLIACCILFAWLLLDTRRAAALLQKIWSLFSPFAIGAAIAFVFNVPMRNVERCLQGVKKAKLRRGLAIILTLFLLIVLVVCIYGLLGPQIRQTSALLSEKIPVFSERAAAKLVILMEQHPNLNNWVRESLHLENLDWTSILKNTLSILGEKASSFMGGAVNMIGNITSALVDTVISIAFAIYCLAQKDTLLRQGKQVLYSVLPERWVDEIIRILRLTNNTFSSFISGQCLEACILGTLFAVTMFLFRMPYIPLVSVVIAVTALIPVVGAFIGCIVGAFFILVDNPLQAVTFVAMFLILQQLENNLIYPRVVGTSIGLPGMWVLVAVTVGGELMGVGGMLLMIPLTSVCYALLREFTERRLKERGIPEEKLQNQPPDFRSRKHTSTAENTELKEKTDTDNKT